jgi:hypothetical protein
MTNHTKANMQTKKFERENQKLLWRIIDYFGPDEVKASFVDQFGLIVWISLNQADIRILAGHSVDIHYPIDEAFEE